MELPLVVTTDRRSDGWAVIRAIGDIDLSTFAALDEQHRVHTRANVPVHLDLSGVSFIDSSGLAALILAKRRSEEHGVGLEIGAVSDYVRHALRLAGLTEWFDGGNDSAIRRIEGH